jgi:hypothetical protein
MSFQAWRCEYQTNRDMGKIGCFDSSILITSRSTDTAVKYKASQFSNRMVHCLWLLFPSFASYCAAPASDSMVSVLGHLKACEVRPLLFNAPTVHVQN